MTSALIVTWDGGGNLPPTQVAQTRSAPQTAFEPLPTIPNE